MAPPQAAARTGTRHNRGVIDINGAEFLIIAVLAVILVGPERLPEYVRGLRALVRRIRGIVADGQQALREEWGEDVNWDALDPRQYDPRRIVRDALFDDDATPTVGTASVAAVASGKAGTGVLGTRRARESARAQDHATPEAGAPFDPEAT